MRVPSRRFELTQDLVIEPTGVSQFVLHRHATKHPVGLGALYQPTREAKSRSWDQEGWATTVPPVITLEGRRELVTQIRRVLLNGAKCGAALLDREEVKKSVGGDLPCDACPEALQARCSEHTAGLVDRYIAQVDQQLEKLTPAVAVGRLELWNRLRKALQDPTQLPSVVLSVGEMTVAGRARPGIRISSDDGVRTELYLDPKAKQWRTTYREVPRTTNDRFQFLIGYLPEDSKIPESAFAFVPRLWWKETAR